MRVWLYYRLSRDDDREMNSLTNQRKILIEYAENNGHTIVGESYDDNVSGMTFDREGIEQIYEEVDKKSIDAIIVKDLSRLGRHKTQTAVFIDFLRQNEVRVLSVTENIDTSNEDDELMIGFKGIFNDMYCRDISRKIRAGYKQKQKEGIVIIPPMGYFKDKNTREVVVVEEQAAIVRRIFEMYTSGYGLKAIAKILNDEDIKTPSYYQKQVLGKRLGYNKPEIARRYLWINTTVKRVLQNEFYTGTLVCHQSYTNKINGVRKMLPPEEHFRHENYVPAIVSREIWEQAQFLLKDKVEKNVRASKDAPCHRYAGLIECGNCGSKFVCRRRKSGDGIRLEYTCNGYHRYGKGQCTPHTIGETDLDKLIYKEIMNIKSEAEKNYNSIEGEVKRWLAKRNTAEKKIAELTAKLDQRRKDQQLILLERIRDREHADVYEQMLKACEDDIKSFTEQIEDIRNYDETIKKRKAEIKEGIDMLDEIIRNGAISDTSLRMLVKKIIITERKGKLKIKIQLNADFSTHIDFLHDDDDPMYKSHGDILVEAR